MNLLRLLLIDYDEYKETVIRRREAVPPEEYYKVLNEARVVKRVFRYDGFNAIVKTKVEWGSRDTQFYLAELEPVRQIKPDVEVYIESPISSAEVLGKDKEEEVVEEKVEVEQAPEMSSGSDSTPDSIKEEPEPATQEVASSGLTIEKPKRHQQTKKEDEVKQPVGAGSSGYRIK